MADWHATLISHYNYNTSFPYWCRLTITVTYFILHDFNSNFIKVIKDIYTDTSINLNNYELPCQVVKIMHLNKRWGSKAWKALGFKKWGLKPTSLTVVCAFARYSRKKYKNRAGKIRENKCNVCFGTIFTQYFSRKWTNRSSDDANSISIKQQNTTHI